MAGADGEGGDDGGTDGEGGDDVGSDGGTDGEGGDDVGGTDGEGGGDDDGTDGEREEDGLGEPVGEGECDGDVNRPCDAATPDADSGVTVVPAGPNSGKNPATTGPGTDGTNLGPARRAAAGGTPPAARADSPGPIGPADGRSWPTATEARS